MDSQIVQEILLMTSLIFLGGMLGGAISEKIKLPDVVLYLLVGIFFGPYGIDILNLGSSSLTVKLILTTGTAFILYLGGREIKLKIVKKVWLTITLLATVGVLISTLVVAVSSKLLLGMPIAVALLLGAILAPTDPATLVPIFQKCSIKRKLTQTITSESAFNDAVGSVLFFTFLSIITSNHLNIAHSFILFFKDISFGILAGILLGVFGTFFISQSSYGFLKNFSPIMSIFVALTSYLVAEYIGGSGFMASFVAGMICGNKLSLGLKCDLKNRRVQEEVNETFGLILRMMIFIVLGTMIDFEILLNNFWIHLLIIAIFIFIARPLTVFASTYFDKKSDWSLNELIFMSWIRETGVMPAALTGMLMEFEIPYIDHIVAISFMTIIITLLLQATTTNLVAKKLNLME
ncbi:cation:proton antiporter [Halanaerobium praevalens]|uniref:Sodium/hydrogen exchanger n=1 Tax=Halanaerobium praevalens (strain ATCC 33744 / DSM 2228 / GSL) TaxID=572479 RepID=E3DRV9_HALPG|nr:sodium:proton antiporter [Halanaerobium praevalens]ADO78173.1 sodium/hydrogen exchanger [Halanaerobium praevalens DSM 2228]